MGSEVEPQTKSNLVHFGPKNMTSGGNNFNHFPDNQLTKLQQVKQKSQIGTKMVAK